MLLMIDNYDSFTYNLVQYLAELDADVRVFRNDQLSVDQVIAMDPDQIVISPGPGTPDDAGISVELIQRCGPGIPILGVCLGHQCLAQAYGGRIVHARRVMHGKTSMIHHDGNAVFANMDNPFEATRYHSLVAEREGLPDCLAVTAWTEFEDGERDEIMGLRHRDYPLQGVQFHPESILTRAGHQLLENFLNLELG